MSLNFDTRSCNPSLPIDDADGVLKYVLQMGSMSTGIPEITLKNYKEVYTRIHALEVMEGRWMIDNTGKVAKPVYITLANVKRWVGMKTNVSSMTRTQFMKRLSRGMDDSIRYLKDEDETEDTKDGE